MTLELRADGTASRVFGYDPHAENMRWFLRGGKLILAPRSGALAIACGYRFKSSEELVLTIEGEEVTLKRTPQPTGKP